MLKTVIGGCMAAAFVLFSATGLRGAGGEVRHVPRDYPTIQSAIDAAEEGDTVMVAPGVYIESVAISKSHIRLRGAGVSPVETAGKDEGQTVVLDGTLLGSTIAGIRVAGTAVARITDVEVTNFEVRNFDRGISVVSAADVRVTHNYVHDNTDKFAPLAIGEAFGIGLRDVSASDVSHNLVSRNGLQGIVLGSDAPANTVHHNRVVENGTQTSLLSGPFLDGSGILVVANANQIQHNEVLASYGRGIAVVRGTSAPLTGVLVAHNRVHRNQRAGISIMLNSTGNIVIHNDARDNNLSGVGPCFRCNLFDNSTGRNGGNFVAFNHGTYSGTDACAS